MEGLVDAATGDPQSEGFPYAVASEPNYLAIALCDGSVDWNDGSWERARLTAKRLAESALRLHSGADACRDVSKNHDWPALVFTLSREHRAISRTGTC
jgi:hypothetical protein